jgi:hypothetical protein
MMARQRELHASTLREILRFLRPAGAQFRSPGHFKENN